MSGEKILAGAREAVAVARGEVPAARIIIAGHAYVPEAEIRRPRAAERSAFKAGFWAWAGPANEIEYQDAVQAEEAAWTAYQQIPQETK